MEQPYSSSKVTVEYFDPFGVYRLLSPGLIPRLPLRNLHWESHAGPLRSIHSLHVDLIANEESQPRSPVGSGDISRVKSSESTSSADDGFHTQKLGVPRIEKHTADFGVNRSRNPAKGRRHQIPGLRQTPYLKVFLLRCDDNETYKLQARKQVREWIKEHTPPAQSTRKLSSQENHDAFEWLIIHVVIPNTAAATQPRITSKGSSTVFEKLRADFNGTSKSAVDRVAQIRIGVNDVPYDILPRVVPAIPGQYTETAQGSEHSWQDLISKFKSLILASFDMRVSQYEDDIREKDAQRTLPGWNFCTFFVLKEGLARGFENVGLVEDSLVGYDELSVGLDTIIREQTITGSGAEHGGSFLPYTEDLLQQLEDEESRLLKEKGIWIERSDSPIDLQFEGEKQINDQEEIPLSTCKKQYRDLILSNDISIFDFKCYLFARQLSLLLRMANAWSSREELLAKLKEQRHSTFQGVANKPIPQHPPEESEDLPLLAEICRRTLDFITSISRIMRDDLLVSNQLRQKKQEAHSENAHGTRDSYRIEIIDNMVSSFTFSVAQQILAQTSTRVLPIPASTIGPPSNALSHPGQEPKSAIPEPKTMMHPARSTSLNISQSVSSNGPHSTGIWSGSSTTSSDQSNLPRTGSTFLKTGMEELAGYRAELYLLSRNVLEDLGSHRNWLIGWEAVSPWLQTRSNNLENVDLHAKPLDSSQEQSKDRLQPTIIHGLKDRLLRSALDHRDAFYRLYEILTDKCLRHYTVAGYTQSVQSNIADLALLKFHLKDFAAAASHFYSITPFYGDRGWEDVEMRMLVLYSQCLKELKRIDEYARVTLKLLAKGASQVRESLNSPDIGLSKRSILISGDKITIGGYLDELMSIVPTLSTEIMVPLQYFFAFVGVDSDPHYHEGRDSFSLNFKFRYLLEDELHVNSLKAKMIPVSGSHSKDIWLQHSEPTIMKSGLVQLECHSNVLIPGVYAIQQVILSIGQMTLSYEHEDNSLTFNGVSSFFRCPRIVIYQRPDAFEMKLSMSKYMHLDRNRSLEIELSSGWNDILNGELHIRAGTAGLRLQTSDVTVLTGKLEVMKRTEVGAIRFGAFKSNSTVKIRLPFNLEREVHDVSLKLEASYTTEKGTFFYAYNHSISIMLSLGVNVQDVFKHEALFSKFTISSASSNPLRLLSSRLEGSDVFTASTGGSLQSPITIFPRQPASHLYKIIRRPQTGERLSGKASLSLILDYVNLEEEIDSAVTSTLTEAIRGTEFWPYSRLIIPTILSHLHSQISSYQIERTAITGELSTSMVTGITWRPHFLGTGNSESKKGDVANRLAAWLEGWVKQTPKISLLPIKATSPEEVPNSRQIIIPVDVPSIAVVHTADIKILSQKSTKTEFVALTNQGIEASLQIRWTRRWDTKPKAGADRDLDFVYEISAPNDTWLIGGRRKGHFKVPGSTPEPENEAPLKFPVVLIPLREGYLPYPNLEIRLLPGSRAHPERSESLSQNQIQAQTHHFIASNEEVKNNEATESGGTGGGVISELDYKNGGEVIRVISNARRTTVSLDASGPQGGAWLLESEQRGVESDELTGGGPTSLSSA